MTSRRELLPDSLAKDIALENIDWRNGFTISVAAFLDKFTLHDSYWIGLHCDTPWTGDATAIILFDPVWNKIGQPAVANTEEWPILLIRFPKVSSINISKYHDIGGIMRGISDADTVVADDKQSITVISDHYGGEISLIHADPIKVLCYSDAAELITLDSGTFSK